MTVDEELFAAITTNDIDKVELLVKNGEVNLSSFNEQNLTPLTLSCKKGFKDIVTIFIKAGATVDEKDNTRIKSTALMTASYEGYIEIVEILIEVGADVNIPNIEGSTALTYATIASRTEIVEMLIAAYANVNITDNLHIESLLVDALLSNSPEIFKILIKAGIEIDNVNINGNSALMIAASLIRYNEINLRSADIIGMFLKAGANLNLTNNEGNSALILSLLKGFKDQLNVAKILIKAGANVNIVNENGESALTWAIMGSHKSNPANHDEATKFYHLNDKKDESVSLSLYNEYIEIIKNLLLSGCDIVLSEELLAVVRNDDLLQNYINTAQLVDSFFAPDTVVTPQDIHTYAKVADLDILTGRCWKIMSNNFSSDNIQFAKVLNYISHILSAKLWDEINDNISDYFIEDDTQLNESLNSIPNIIVTEIQKKEFLSKLWLLRKDCDLSVSSIIAQVYDISPFSLLEFINLRYENSQKDLSPEASLALPPYIDEILKFYNTHSKLNYNETKILLESATLTPEEIYFLKMSIVNADLYMLENNFEKFLDKAFELNYFDNIENILKLPIPAELKNALNEVYENRCQELYEELIQEPNVEARLDIIPLPTPLIKKLEAEFPDYKDELEKKSQADQAKYRAIIELDTESIEYQEKLASLKKNAYSKFHALNNRNLEQNNSLEADNDLSQELTETVISECNNENDALVVMTGAINEAN